MELHEVATNNDRKSYAEFKAQKSLLQLLLGANI